MRGQAATSTSSYRAFRLRLLRPADRGKGTGSSRSRSPATAGSRTCRPKSSGPNGGSLLSSLSRSTKIVPWSLRMTSRQNVSLPWIRSVLQPRFRDGAVGTLQGPRRRERRGPWEVALVLAKPRALVTMPLGGHHRLPMPRWAGAAKAARMARGVTDRKFLRRDLAANHRHHNGTPIVTIRNHGCMHSGEAGTAGP